MNLILFMKFKVLFHIFLICAALSRVDLHGLFLGYASEVKCVNSLGQDETQRCSDYISILNGTVWSLPIPVPEGYKCFAGQQIESPYC